MNGLLGNDLERVCHRAAELVARWGGGPVPDLGAFQVDDSGWDFRVFHVGPWCLRAARRPEAAVRMEREAAALAVVRTVVGLPMPAPDELAPGVTVGPWLEGRPLTAEDVPAVADELAHALHALHALAPSAIGVEAGEGHQEATRQEALEVLNQARQHRLQSPDVAVLAVGIEDPTLWSYPPTLVHADLTPNHILVSEDGTALAGLLDWSDLRVDDPAIDLAGIGCAVGEESGDLLVDAYLRCKPQGAAIESALKRRVRLREAWGRIVEELHNAGCRRG
ncbi:MULTISPECIES: phosphotransferase [Streptomyces]|uniref:Phosphotransferase n=1 Tax=Streptomyces ehimensis TaxID=68195 RepID=A0ABV9BQS5_9ACTN